MLEAFAVQEIWIEWLSKHGYPNDFINQGNFNGMFASVLSFYQRKLEQLNPYLQCLQKLQIPDEDRFEQNKLFFRGKFYKLKFTSSKKQTKYESCVNERTKRLATLKAPILNSIPIQIQNIALPNEGTNLNHLQINSNNQNDLTSTQTTLSIDEDDLLLVSNQTLISTPAHDLVSIHQDDLVSIHQDDLISTQIVPNISESSLPSNETILSTDEDNLACTPSAPPLSPIQVGLSELQWCTNFKIGKPFAIYKDSVTNETVVLKNNKQTACIPLLGLSQDNIEIEYKEGINFNELGIANSATRLRTTILSDNFEWHQSYFDIFTPKDVPFQLRPKLPKLERHYHPLESGIARYVPSRHLAFHSTIETELPGLKELREAMEVVAKSKFNSVAILLFNYNSHIGLHKDKGLKDSEVSKEVILSISCLGTKLFHITTDNERHSIFLPHSQGSLYILRGLQKHTKHEKLNGGLNHRVLAGHFQSLEEKAKGTHISLVFCNLDVSAQNNAIEALYSTVTVTWNESKTECKYFKYNPPCYQFLAPNEPIGFIWPSLNHLVQFGGHAEQQKGICSRNHIVYSLYENGYYDNKCKNGNFFYVGYREKNESNYTGYNKSMMNNFKSNIPIRLYIGSRSKFPQAPTKKGEVLFFGLVYVINVSSKKVIPLPMPKITESTSAAEYNKYLEKSKKIYEPTFELSPQKPTISRQLSFD